MEISSRHGRVVLYVLIFLSGIAGLIYQVVWHKYLSILLGAQARATAIVLAIFLGGISAGYHCFGRWSRYRRWNLLLVYALVEVALGFWAYLFPHLFRVVMPLTYRLYGVLGVDSLVIDVLISIVLVGLPTFLMGGTLPLLTQGLSEDVAGASSTHARIYGWNTVGACFGSLLAGYILIPATDLPVTVSLAGTLNVLVAVVTYFGFARGLPPQKVTARREGTRRETPSTATLLLFGVAFCSGFYVLTLETVLIRLVGLSTGSSNYNFTLIVSIFVFGLGFGSLLARKIGEATERRLFWNQALVALALMALYVSGDHWSYWVHLLRIPFRDSVENFYLFQFSLGMMFLALLAVPIGFCGLTLPLCFHLLKDKKETLGHRVGQLYGLNTVGCVMGALLGGYVLLRFLDLDQLFKFCVFVSLVSSSLAAALWLRKSPAPRIELGVAGAAITIVLMGVLFAPPYHKERFIQPFRQQSPVLDVSYSGVEAWGRYLGSSSSYLHYKDGPNSSVGIGVTKVNGAERSRTIFVNGKSDGNTRGDFFTMNMTGHYPGLFARRLDRVCVIGFGTGITVGALARYDEAKEINVVEISDTILDAAKYFDPYNGDVSTNPKVKFHAMDAFRYLGGTRERFDVIVSEPSNPWVAGVENLYSAEFYSMAKEKLADDGLFVQWVQSYSFNDDLFQMVLRTITGQFPHVSVFQMLEHDMALVASNKPLGRDDILRALSRYEKNPSVKRSLAEAGISRFETVLALELIPGKVTPVLASEGEEHRLETPRLSHAAARAFFVSSTARVHSLRRVMKEFYPGVESSLLTQYLQGRAPDRELLEAFRSSFCDHQHAKSRVLCKESVLMGKWDYPIAPYEVLFEGTVPKSDYRSLAALRAPASSKTFNADDFKVVQEMFDLYKEYYSPIARIPIEPVLARLDNCLSVVKPSEELYGECLLQKAAVLEIAQPSSPQFLPVVRRFGDWFGTLSQQTTNYRRFKRAAEIMDKLSRELASSNKAGGS